MTESNQATFFSAVLRRALLCAAAAFALAGCHHGITKAFKAKDCNRPQPYDRAQSIAPLRVPPGVDPPDTHTALRVPAYNEPTPPPRRLTDPCLDEPPPFASPAASATKPVPSS